MTIIYARKKHKILAMEQTEESKLLGEFYKLRNGGEKEQSERLLRRLIEIVSPDQLISLPESEPYDESLLQAVATYPGINYKILFENEERIINVNVQGTGGDTGLHRACWHVNQGAVQVLLELGADVNLQDDDQRTPLMKSSTTSRSLQISELLIKAGANIHAIDKNGENALHHACKWDDIEAIKFLISKGCRLDVRNKEGKSPINSLPRHSLNARHIKEYVELITPKQ